MIFYTIHSLPWGENLENSKRNCITFLIGITIWYLIYVLILHNSLTIPFFDLIKSNVYILILADISVMGYTYKNYYGREIFEEFKDNKHWDYDEKNHKYIYKRQFTKHELNCITKIQSWWKKIYAKNKKNIEKEKAIIKIQRACHDWLYSPDYRSVKGKIGGLMYLKSKKSFENSFENYN